MDKIIEGNRLIARFMGWEILPDGTVSNKEWADKYSPADNFIPEILSYHSSWDWLMPVVEKIEAISTPLINKVWVSIEGKTCSIWTYFDAKEVLRREGHDDGGKFKCRNHSKESKVLATWLCIIEFIKWYNTQNK